MTHLFIGFTVKKKYLIDKLAQSIQGGETAKLVFQKKEGRNSFDGHQKKNGECSHRDKSDGEQKK